MGNEHFCNIEKRYTVGKLFVEHDKKKRGKKTENSSMNHISKAFSLFLPGYIYIYIYKVK